LKTEQYNTTCPFVERVWKQAKKLGTSDHTIIIHGKHNHEETRATFSHSDQNGHSLIIKDINEAQILEQIILGERSTDDFTTIFEGRYSKGFDVEQDLQKIGVVNQTTMLASETQEIADFLKDSMIKKYSEENYKNHFADTRDTLCYATNDNQQATFGLLKESADIAIVVGGYNSSNTSHIVELCEQKLPTFYIDSADEIKSAETIHHFDYHNKKELITNHFLPEEKKVIRIILTSGASCPDTMVDNVLDKLLSYFDSAIDKEAVIESFKTESK